MYEQAAAEVSADGVNLPAGACLSVARYVAGAVCAAVLGLSVHPAHAQAATAEAQSASASDVLEEVTVTAEKRRENLQTTAVTANVLGAAELAAKEINNLESLQFSNPGLSVTEAGITANVNIRGIGRRRRRRLPRGPVPAADTLERAAL
jgi:outer membrane receptor protein involved in Fe transport